MDYIVAYSPYKPDGWAIRMLWEESAWTILLPTHPISLTGGLLGCCGRSLHGPILLPAHPTSLTGGLLGCCGRSLHGPHIKNIQTRIST